MTWHISVARVVKTIQISDDMHPLSLGEFDCKTNGRAGTRSCIYCKGLVIHSLHENTWIE